MLKNNIFLILYAKKFEHKLENILNIMCLRTWKLAYIKSTLIKNIFDYVPKKTFLMIS